MEFLGDLGRCLCLGGRVGLFEGHLPDEFEITHPKFELGERPELSLDQGDSLHVLLGRLAVVPEARLGHAGLDGREFLCQCGRVKNLLSEPRRSASPEASKVVRSIGSDMEERKI